MKQRITPILKSLLIAYLLTGGLLLVLALLLYRFHLSEGVVTGCIVAIYVVASCLAGFLMGKNADGSVSKLSKRHGAVSFQDLVNDGFLPETIINYIASKFLIFRK